MAVVSSNKKGNPYHDEKTGEFTSAGFGALSGEIRNGSFDKKRANLNAQLNKYPGKTELEKWLNFVSSVDMKNFNFFMDSTFSIPLLNLNFNLAASFDRKNIRENHNAGLDTIGVDFIAYDDNVGFMKNENLFNKLDLIDVKTSYDGTVKLNIFQLVDAEGNLLQDVLANPNLKGNNQYVFSFIDIGGAPDDMRQFAAARIVDMFSGRSKNYPMEAYKVHKGDLLEVIHANLDLQGILDKAEEFDKDLSELSYYDFAEKHFSKFEFKDLGGARFEYSLPIGETGLTLCAAMTPESDRYGFRMYLSVDKSFVDKYFANNKLTRK